MALSFAQFSSIVHKRWNQLKESDMKYALLFTAVLFLIRLPNGFFVNNFWAEDGRVFFLEDYTLGPAAIFKIYAGYLHVLIRLVAFVLGFLPLIYVPVAYKIMGLLVQFLLPLYAASPRWNVSIQQRFLMVVLTGALPNGGEIFGNMANQMATAGLLIAILTTINPSQNRGQSWIDAFLYFICALTGPYILILAPFVFLRFWFMRTSFNKLERRWAVRLSTLTALSVMIQLYCLDVASRFVETSHSIEDWAQGMVNFINPLMISNRPNAGPIKYVIAVFVIWFIWKVIFSSHKKISDFAKSFQVYWAIYGCLVMASVYLVNRQWPSIMHPYGSGIRYFYLPYFLILWAIVTSEPETLRLKKIKKYFLWIMLITSLAKLDSEMTQNDFDFPRQLEDFELTGNKVFKINPVPWDFTLNKNNCWRCRL